MGLTGVWGSRTAAVCPARSDATSVPSPACLLACFSLPLSPFSPICCHSGSLASSRVSWRSVDTTSRCSISPVDVGANYGQSPVPIPVPSAQQDGQFSAGGNPAQLQ